MYSVKLVHDTRIAVFSRRPPVVTWLLGIFPTLGPVYDKSSCAQTP